MNVAILGGGVAGVSVAIALKQKGFDVTVYERRQTETNIGAGIIVWPNAACVLDKLDILNRIEAVSGCPTKMQRLSHTGENLGEIDIEAINRTMGYPSFSILRADFQNILITKLNESGVRLNYAHDVIQIHNNGDNPQIHFENGKTASADIIIGADGRMSSVSRQYISGNNHPIYQNVVNWIGTYESEKKIFPDIVVKDYWGIGERFGIVPVSQYKGYWAGGISSPEIGENDPKRYAEELLGIFSGWPTIASEMITGTPVDRINKIHVHDHDPLKVWHRNNVVVIGDAAHAALPTSGQGACQALEDAWHLANCLAKNGTNIAQAFSEFTDLRSEKTEKIIASGRSLASSIFNVNSDFCKMRNESSKSTDYLRVATGMAQAWSQNLINV